LSCHAIRRFSLKNTSVAPCATGDAIPGQNHTAKMGARMMRGMAFSALMGGY